LAPYPSDTVHSACSNKSVDSSTEVDSGSASNYDFDGYSSPSLAAESPASILPLKYSRSGLLPVKLLLLSRQRLKHPLESTGRELGWR
jgi:hypothetical protein